MTTATLSSAPSSVKQAELLAMLERVQAGTLSVEGASAEPIGVTAKPAPVFVPLAERWHTPQRRVKLRGGRRAGAGRKPGCVPNNPLAPSLFREWETLCNTDPLTEPQAARLRVLTDTLIDATSGRIVGDPNERTVRMRDGRVGVRNQPERIPVGVIKGYLAWKRS